MFSLLLLLPILGYACHFIQAKVEGAHLSELPATNLEACLQLCRLHEECEYFSFGEDQEQCLLFDSGNFTESSDYVSGWVECADDPRFINDDCFYNAIDFPRNDVASFVNVPNLLECVNLATGVPEARYVTFNVNTHQCWAKSRVSRQKSYKAAESIDLGCFMSFSTDPPDATTWAETSTTIAPAPSPTSSTNAAATTTATTPEFFTLDNDVFGCRHEGLEVVGVSEGELENVDLDGCIFRCATTPNCRYVTYLITDTRNCRLIASDGAVAAPNRHSLTVDVECLLKATTTTSAPTTTTEHTSFFERNPSLLIGGAVVAAGAISVASAWPLAYKMRAAASAAAAV